MSSDFTQRRAASLARMGGYALLLVFLIALVGLFLPPPFVDPQRLFTALVELVERSTVPLVAVLVLFWGFSGSARPALWECGLVARLRPLLLLVAALYLLTAISLGLIGQRLEASGHANADAQLRRSQAELKRARELVAEITDEATLKAWLASQPALLQAVEQQQQSAPDPANPEGTRERVNRLLDLGETNLRRSAVQARAGVSGRIWAQVLRASLTALVYSLYFLGAHLVWPRSLLGTRERAWKRRQKAVAAES